MALCMTPFLKQNLWFPAFLSSHVPVLCEGTTFLRRDKIHIHVQKCAFELVIFRGFMLNLIAGWSQKNMQWCKASCFFRLFWMRKIRGNNYEKRFATVESGGSLLVIPRCSVNNKWVFDQRRFWTRHQIYFCSICDARVEMLSKLEWFNL